jgi:phosphoserine aminotransferase
MAKVHNFSAGPCILPQEVFKEASQSVLDFDNLGLSILEISHRSENFVRVMEEARELVKELLNIPKGYTVLFLQGGASTGFLMAPYNLLTENGTAGYMNTGTWSTKAIKEAKKLGNVDVIVSSEDENFKYIPKDIQIPSGLDYVHYTANNTIYGTQFKKLPQTDNFLVCDMSSDIFSRPVTINAYDIIYAGAQKNIGPAGTTMYIVNEEVFNKSGRDIPSMLDFEVHHKKDSMFNTHQYLLFT